MKLHKLIALAVLGSAVASNSLAQVDEGASSGVQPSNPGSRAIQGAPDLTGDLFVGTSQNSTDPTATLNDVFQVDPTSGAATSIYSNTGVWGATADPDNQRILFTTSSGTGFGDELMSVPYSGGAPTSLGLITAGGAPQRIDGLAMVGGTLYGTVADAVTNGLYSIDLGTLVATQIAAHPAESISGIDADPDTGIIYGVNDATGQLVTIATDGTITNLAAYPGGFADIDGIAVGGGFAYLVTDEAQDISVYDLINDVYVASLPSPFTNADVFSAGALAIEPLPLDADVALTKTASGGDDLGGAVTFDLWVDNNGPADATAVVVTDTFPDNVDYTSDSCGGSYGGGVFTWNVGIIANGGSAHCTVNGVVSDFGAISNTASVSAAENDPVPGNNSSTAGLEGVARVIPTLGVWGLIAMISLVLGIAVVTFRRD